MTKKIKTWFVVSDLHSFYIEFKEALKLAGFDKKNKTHGLIVCGDIFDRGPDSLSIYKFLKSLPKYRCVLVKGNHESLYLNLLNKAYPDRYDFSNRTVETFCQITNYSKEVFEDSYWYRLDLNTDSDKVWKNMKQAWKEIKELVKNSPITKWLQSDQWVDYFELDKYIFVHSFIPTKIAFQYKFTSNILDQYETTATNCFEYESNWRDASIRDWEEARWGDPIDQYLQGFFDKEIEKGKVLVVGHWHTSDFYWRISRIKSYDSPIHDIWYGKGLIALDGGVFRTAYGNYYHPQNVLIIKTDNFDKVYNKYGEEIKQTKALFERVGIAAEEITND